MRTENISLHGIGVGWCAWYFIRGLLQVSHLIA